MIVFYQGTYRNIVILRQKIDGNPKLSIWSLPPASK